MIWSVAFISASIELKAQNQPSMILPAFAYLACWYLLAGSVYYFLGIETKGRSIEEIHGDLVKPIPISGAGAASERVGRTRHTAGECVGRMHDSRTFV